jgi:hypothetical protein
MNVHPKNMIILNYSRRREVQKHHRIHFALDMAMQIRTVYLSDEDAYTDNDDQYALELKTAFVERTRSMDTITPFFWWGVGALFGCKRKYAGWLSFSKPLWNDHVVLVTPNPEATDQYWKQSNPKTGRQDVTR